MKLFACTTIFCGVTQLLISLNYYHKNKKERRFPGNEMSFVFVTGQLLILNWHWSSFCEMIAGLGKQHFKLATSEFLRKDSGLALALVCADC